MCLNNHQRGISFYIEFLKNPPNSSKIAIMSQDSSGLFSFSIIDDDSGVDPQIKSREQNMSDIESISRIDMGSK